jgi:S1-C subfamily serine protease
MAANIAPGTPWLSDGRTSIGPCALGYVEIVRWKEENNRIESLESWERVFRKELAAAGFSVGGDPTNLFEQRQSSDLQLGALITDVRVKACTSIPIATELFGGSASMTVEWQLYSVGQAKVVARIATSGGVNLKPSKQGSPSDLLMSAFGDNVRRLAADETFRQALTAEAAPATAPARAQRAIRFAAAGRVPIALASKSVVLVLGADGNGSGVVISSDGYILTNHHVAGSGGQVRIRWSDGRETVGDVVAADARRDVALLRTEGRAAALPVRPTSATVGEAVYAIGTPLDPKFQGSVTKGIVSANRTYDGLAFIQSDVAVNHGNSGGPLVDDNGAIIGLTVSGYDVSGAPVGINLFIPIDDALKALALTPAA